MTELELKNKRQVELTLEEMIKIQNVKPYTCSDDISKFWPVDDDGDKFIEFIMQERKERREATK